MRRSTFVTVCVLALTALVQAQSSSPAKPQKATGSSQQDLLIALEKERTAAILSGDVQAVDRTTPDDYTAIGSLGQVRNKQQVIEEFRSGEMKLTADDLDEFKVRILGKVAVLTGRATLKGTFKGKDISGQFRFTRIYEERNGKWVPIAYQSTRIVPAA